MAEIPAEIIECVYKYSVAIKDIIDVKKIFLFGSFAKGNSKKESDIDVCVVADGIENNFAAMLEIAPKVLDIDWRIEPVVFSLYEYENESDFGILKEVKKYGVEVSATQI